MPTISALDYGAKPNDSVNDSAAINAALKAANALYLKNPSAGPGTVALSAGTYIVSGTGNKSDGAIKLLTGTTLQGAGMGQTVLKVADNWAGDITGVVRTPYGAVTTNATVLNLTIDGNRDSTTGKIDGFFCGVRPGSTLQDADITLDGVEIKDCSGYGFDPHEQTTRLTIENCVAHGNGLDGFVADFIIDGVYRNNVAYDNDRHGFNVCTSSSDILLENNKAYDNGSAGVVVQRGSENIPWPHDILITGGEYRGNVREGILIKMSDNVTVTKATIFGNLREGVRIEGATDTIVQGSAIFNNSQAGHNLYDQVNILDRADSTTGKTYYSLRAQILDNKIYSDGAIDARWGIREAPTNDDGGASGIVVSNNDITGMATGTVTITSNSTDRPMVAADDTYSATEDTALAINAADGVLKNDTALDGGKEVVPGQFATTKGGTVILNKDGSFVYTPKTDFFGSDSFSYTAFDVDGDRATATVTLNVKDVAETPNDNPMVVRNDTYAATEDKPLTISASSGVLANDTALDGGKAVVAGQVDTAKGGTVLLNQDGSFTYTPKTDFFGSDSFFYTAYDADGDQAQGTVTLNVADVADPPPSTAFPAVAVGTTQLEKMALKNFSLVSLKTAQGGQAVENRTKNVEATAKGTFTGETGTYKVKVVYYDENDGASPMGIRVNGVTVKSWVADKQLGSTGADIKTLTFYDASLQLTKGATLEVYGTRQGDELVRVDTLSVTQWDQIA
jgi:hypothetical protein